jgi:hypothetical protein
MSRATNELFDTLHGLLTEAMIEDLKRYRQNKEGIPPAFLAQCIKLLKDNGIDSPARAVKMLDTLKGSLPDFEFADGSAH